VRNTTSVADAHNTGALLISGGPRWRRLPPDYDADRLRSESTGDERFGDDSRNEENTPRRRGRTARRVNIQIDGGSPALRTRNFLRILSKSIAGTPGHADLSAMPTSFAAKRLCVVRFRFGSGRTLNGAPSRVMSRK